jgi:hypothetical protein
MSYMSVRTLLVLVALIGVLIMVLLVLRRRRSPGGAALNSIGSPSQPWPASAAACSQRPLASRTEGAAVAYCSGCGGEVADVAAQFCPLCGTASSMPALAPVAAGASQHVPQEVAVGVAPVTGKPGGLSRPQEVILGLCSAACLALLVSALHAVQTSTLAMEAAALVVGGLVAFLLARRAWHLPLMVTGLALMAVFTPTIRHAYVSPGFVVAFCAPLCLWGVFGFMRKVTGPGRRLEAAVGMNVLIGVLAAAVVGLSAYLASGVMHYAASFLLAGLALAALISLAFLKSSSPEAREARRLASQQASVYQGPYQQQWVAGGAPVYRAAPPPGPLPYAQGPMSYAQGPMPYGPGAVPYVPNHMTWAIISVVFLFPFTAFAAISQARRVDRCVAFGDIVQAQEASRKARKWCLVSTIISGVGWLLVAALVIVILTTAE